MRPQAWGLLLGVAIACLASCRQEVGVATATRLITTPADRLQEGDGWWGERHRRLTELVKQGGWDIVFVGDSITQGWEASGRASWDRYYGVRKALNLGYKGDRIEHVLWRLENGETNGPAPKVVVVMIGTNNTSYRRDPPESIAAGVGRIVAVLRERWSEAKLLVLGIFPRGAASDDPLRVNNQRANHLIAALADGRAVFFLDIGSVFLTRDGQLTPALMPDLLHLSPKAYAIWAAAMEPQLGALLGDGTSLNRLPAALQ